MIETFGHNCHLLRNGLEFSRCKFQKPLKNTKMTDYTIVKELQNKFENLNDKYLELNQNYVKVLKENQKLKEVKNECIGLLAESRYNSKRIDADNIQAIINKIYAIEESTI